MATGSGIEVVGLQQFRRDLKLAQTGLTRELSSALKKAGAPPLGRVKVLAGRTSRSPRSTGLLQKSYKVSVRGTAAYLKSSVPYAAGAEWGVYGKWAGFRLRYPGPEPGGRGRFAWRAVLEEREGIAEVLDRELRQLIELNGWATPTSGSVS